MQYGILGEFLSLPPIPIPPPSETVEAHAARRRDHEVLKGEGLIRDLFACALAPPMNEWEAEYYDRPINPDTLQLIPQDPPASTAEVADMARLITQAALDKN